MPHDYQALIHQAFENKSQYSPTHHPSELANAITVILSELNQGILRVAEKQANQWIVNDWIKKAILLSFITTSNKIIQAGDLQYFDKIAPKYSHHSEQDFINEKARLVPSSYVRYGSYIGKNVIVMPSFVNIGAYVDEGCMIDTWATVGSCAQIGKNVHLSGGVGIGGVLEPLQANPTIIEDNCFIGARSEIVEGVIIEKNSVISMGVFIGQSTKIYNRMTKEIIYGRVPEGSVVVPGSLPSEDGSHSLACAVIIKQIDERTRLKTSINELLR
ncbi:MAG: 2,3,4,5-tetrahydropyridine-2,6-dicarboxylate N-succinyltransferase [Pseudomonadota bacterium]